MFDLLVELHQLHDVTLHYIKKKPTKLLSEVLFIIGNCFFKVYVL